MDPAASGSPRPGDGAWRRRLAPLVDDATYLRLIDRIEQQLAKLLGLLLVVVMVAASLQLIGQVGWALAQPGTPWLGAMLTSVLGDLLNLLIALEVLQNITSYLRRHVVQIELVLLTAITAVARKVIVLPAGAESKPQLLMGLGLAVLCLAASYWLVGTISLRRLQARTGPARRFREPDRSPPGDGGDGPESAGRRRD